MGWGQRFEPRVDAVAGTTRAVIAARSVLRQAGIDGPTLADQAAASAVEIACLRASMATTYGALRLVVERVGEEVRPDGHRHRDRVD